MVMIHIEIEANLPQNAGLLLKNLISRIFYKQKYRLQKNQISGAICLETVTMFTWHLEKQN